MTLQQAITMARAAIKAQRWNEARFQLSRARALVNALPTALTAREREQLSLLRKRFAARDTPAAQSARSAKQAKQTPAARAGSRKPAAKSTAKKKSTVKAAQKPKPAPVRDLGARYINRAALGYAPADEA